jgi:hypothetical protein
MTIREALLGMGYKELKSGCWIKPFGFACLSYVEAKNEWKNSFKDMQGGIGCWETKSFHDDPKKHGGYLAQLKHFECWTKTDFVGNADSSFQLMAIDL